MAYGLLFLALERILFRQLPLVGTQSPVELEERLGEVDVETVAPGGWAGEDVETVAPRGRAGEDDYDNHEEEQMEEERKVGFSAKFYKNENFY